MPQVDPAQKKTEPEAKEPKPWTNRVAAMSHRAAVYTVRVRQKRDTSGSFRLLGDIDDEGTSLSALLQNYFHDFESISEDDTKVVRSVQCDVVGDDIQLLTQHGQNGVAADIVGPDGDLRLRQTPDDTQLLRCGCLFRLPPAQDTGWLAVHINNRRGIKGLLQKGIADLLHQDYPDLMLDITPFVEASILQEAVSHDRIDKIKLVKFEQPNDRAAAATSRWVPASVIGRLELDITPKGKGNRLLSGLLQRFLNGDTAAFGEIVEFQGITFEQAKVEVQLADSRKRTFNIEKPEAGHPFTEDLEDLTIENGEPTSASLFEGLRATLASVAR